LEKQNVFIEFWKCKYNLIGQIVCEAIWLPYHFGSLTIL